MKRTCLVLGGADTLPDDVKNVDFPYHGVVVCNMAGLWWSGEIDAWVSLHPSKFFDWMAERRKREWPDPKKLVAMHSAKGHSYITKVQCKYGVFFDFDSYVFKNARTGSSGLFALKYALCALKYDYAVLCGIPMVYGPHWDRLEKFNPRNFLQAWREIPLAVQHNSFSMSGWTRAYLGGPESLPLDAR